MSREKIELQVSDDDGDVAYVYLPEHPRKPVFGVVAKQVRLLDLVEGYKGPDVYLDLRDDGTLLGIEILT